MAASMHRPVLLVAAMALPAANASAQGPLVVPGAPVTDSVRHSVYRPAFDLPTRRPSISTGFEVPTKPIFLGGYAGYNYGRGPRLAYLPTGYGTGTIQQVEAAGGRPPGPARSRWGRWWGR